MDSKKGIYSLITVVTLLVTQVVLRNIGIENLSAHLFVALLVIACSLAVFGVYKDGNKGFGIPYNTIITILLIVASITMGITIVLLKGYPDLMDKYGTFIGILSLVSYLALLLFIIIYRIVYEVKNR